MNQVKNVRRFRHNFGTAKAQPRWLGLRLIFAVGPNRVVLGF